MRNEPTPAIDLEALRARRDAAQAQMERWACSAEEFMALYAAGDRDFRFADLTRADLRDADLRDADLTNANLLDADLRFANLRDADLRFANLRDADLRFANLRDADLTNANLLDANLTNAYLGDANLTRVDLSGTILDPSASMPDSDFSTLGEIDAAGYITCYRTRISQHVGNTQYEVGKTYSAPAFSVDVATDCHPGLYVASLEWLKLQYPGEAFVQVRVKASETLRTVGGKFRTKCLEVLANVEAVQA